MRSYTRRRSVLKGGTVFNCIDRSSEPSTRSPRTPSSLIGAEIANFVHKFGDKVKDLKTLYGFRLLVKDRAAAYKKTIGEDVDPEKLRELIWNAMDSSSKMMATQMG